jgi:hypothetical protein
MKNLFHQSVHIPPEIPAPLQSHNLFPDAILNSNKIRYTLHVPDYCNAESTNVCKTVITETIISTLSQWCQGFPLT